MIDDRRHLLFGDPGVDEHEWTAGLALVERGVDVGCLASCHDRQGGVAGSACLHGDQDVDLLLRDQGVEGLLRAGGAGCIVGDFKHELPAKHAAFGVDLIDGKLRGLDNRRRNDAVGAGQPHGNTDLDGIGREREAGQRGRGRGQE